MYVWLRVCHTSKEGDMGGMGAGTPHCARQAETVVSCVRTAAPSNQGAAPCKWHQHRRRRGVCMLCSCPACLPPTNHQQPLLRACCFRLPGLEQPGPSQAAVPTPFQTRGTHRLMMAMHCQLCMGVAMHLPRMKACNKPQPDPCL